mgnify:CR=1 FL=1
MSVYFFTLKSKGESNIMKKIIKRLLTGVLTLATVFTALPVTQVHAADSVYTQSDGKTGTVIKVTDGGEVESTFQEGWMKADGETAYCIQLGVAFQSGYKTRKDATERLNQSQITDVALNLEYIKEHTKKGFTDECMEISAGDPHLRLISLKYMK